VFSVSLTKTGQFLLDFKKSDDPMPRRENSTFDVVVIAAPQTSDNTPLTLVKFIHCYECHRFKLRNQDNYIRVAFDQFWSKRHFQGHAVVSTIVSSLKTLVP